MMHSATKVLLVLFLIATGLIACSVLFDGAGLAGTIGIVVFAGALIAALVIALIPMVQALTLKISIMNSRPQRTSGYLIGFLGMLMLVLAAGNDSGQKVLNPATLVALALAATFIFSAWLINHWPKRKKRFSHETLERLQSRE